MMSRLIMFDIIDKLPVNNEELIIINSTTGLKRLNNLSLIHI